MKKQWVIALLLSLPLNVPLYNSVAADTLERLDDSASPRASVQAPLVLSEKGKLLSDSPEAEYAIMKFGWVHYRLATQSYKGKKVNIYYTIPDNLPGLLNRQALKVEWRGDVFNSGSAYASDRQLVWSGTITDNWLDEKLDLTAIIKLDQLRLTDEQKFGFEAYFEIELLP